MLEGGPICKERKGAGALEDRMSTLTSLMAHGMPGQVTHPVL